jgi:hypothetical protein
MEAATASYDTPEGGRNRRPLSTTRLAFRFRSRVLGVTTEDAWAAELLTSTYEPMLCAQSDANERAYIPASSGFEGAFYAVRDTFAQFAAREPSSLALYAASIALNHAGVLLLGETCIGKTLLTLNLAYNGAQFLGDETALLDSRTGSISALPRRVSLREPGLKYLLDEAAAPRVAACTRAYHTPNGRLWYALDEATLGVRRVSNAYPLRAILLLDERAAEPAIEQIPMWQLLPAVSRRVHGDGASVARVANLYTRLRNVRGFRVRLGSPRQTTDLVLETLRHCV